MGNPWWKAPKIVICYRRQDAVDSTGRLYRDLNLRFNSRLRNYLWRKVVVVRDFDNIPGGMNYEDFIRDEIQTSAAILAVIGNDWLKVTDPRTGQRRIDDPRDSLRKELTTALALSKPVIPVLVERAQMPGEEDLPEALQPLAKKSAREINDPEWDAGVERLVKDLERILSWRLLNFGFIALALSALILLVVAARGVISRWPSGAPGDDIGAATPAPRPSPEHTQRPGADANQKPANVTPSPATTGTATPIPTPTTAPTPTPVEGLAGSMWEYRFGSNVRYEWTFLPGGRLKGRIPERGTNLPDGRWEQEGDSVTIQTSVNESNQEVYKGRIEGDRMRGTYTNGLEVYNWTAIKIRAPN